MCYLQHMCMYLDHYVVMIEFEAMRLKHAHSVHREPMLRYDHHQLVHHRHMITFLLECGEILLG